MRKKQTVDFELSPPIPAEEVGYWRVSTGRDQNPDMQISALKRRGIPDDNIFGDEKSGRKFDRPQLELALKLMYGRPGWTLVVWKLDRLGRNTVELLKLVQELTEAGQNLVSITEAIDTRTAMGKAFIGMLAVFAQFESDTTAERSRAGMERAKERGSQVGRKTMFSRAQFGQIERLILAKRGKPLSLNRIARRFRCSVAAIHFHFPGWRGKTVKERKQYRREHPLPKK